jgi:hypothetical protein
LLLHHFTIRIVSESEVPVSLTEGYRCKSQRLNHHQV